MLTEHVSTIIFQCFLEHVEQYNCVRHQERAIVVKEKCLNRYISLTAFTQIICVQV